MDKVPPVVCSTDASGKVVCQQPIDYAKLYKLQNSTIEHKFEPQGIWELMVTHAGDVFRGLSKEYPDGGYVGEKVWRLSRYLEPRSKEFFGLEQGDFTEYEKYVNGETEYYTKEQIKVNQAKYLADLKALKEATEKEVTDPVRKVCMVDSLDMISELVDYYGKSPQALPSKQFRKMKSSVKKCLEQAPHRWGYNKF
ncbi:Uncharacterised protein [uncultured archaeon]|nr:Uncharacterised protein [uncultured archaeon]